MIHQMKGNIFAHLIVTVILNLDMKGKCCICKPVFFHFYFSNVHISLNTVFSNLFLFVHVHNIHVEGTVSQIFI